MSEYPQSQWTNSFQTSVRTDKGHEAEQVRKGMGGRARRATEEELQALKDLTEKAARDTMKATDTTLSLASDLAGPAGIWLLSQKLVGLMSLGAAMALYTLRTGEMPGKDREGAQHKIKDDMLYVMLLAYVAETSPDHQDGDPSFMRQAQALFEKVTGREYPMPTEWLVFLNKKD